MVSEARVESQKKWSSHEVELLASEKNVYSIDEAGISGKRRMVIL